MMSANDETRALRERILAVFNKWDGDALKKQKKAIQFTTISSLLIPIAVLLMTIQVLAFRSAGIIAVVLISLELGALLFSLLILVCRLAPRAGEWAHERLRAEVLRREGFLLLARVGPYLERTSPAELELTMAQRLAQIDNCINPPDTYLPLRKEKPWRDELEDAGLGKTAPPQPGCLEDFLKDRVLDQRDWFWAKRGKSNRLNWRFENIIRGTLVMAIVIASMHLISLIFGTYETGGGRPLLRLVIEIAAITLPPIGSAAAALQAVFQGRRLGRSYKLHSLDLDVLHHELLALGAAKTETTISQENYEFQLKRLVLRTEELLANELRVWYFIMRPGLS